MNEERESKLKISVRWLLGGLLVGSSLSKIGNLQDFYVSIVAYQMALPGVLVRLTAMILPWLELLCGLLLIGRIWTRAALLWALAMFVVFMVATGQAWARGLDISCGCFNLKAYGFDPASGKALGRFIESVGFAFFRALFLFLGAFYLFRTNAPPSPGDAVRGR